MQKRNLKNTKKNYFFTLSGMIVLMFIFAKSFYWSYDEMSKRKVLLGAIILGGIVVVPFLVSMNTVLSRFCEKIIIKVGDTVKNLRCNKKQILLKVFLLALEVGVTYFISYFSSILLWKTTFNERLFYTMLAVVFIVTFLRLEWKKAANKPEQIFAVCALVLGLFCIGVTPTRVGVSWDDEIHYGKTLEISDFLNGIRYKADEKNITDYASNIYAHSGYDKDSEQKYTQELQKIYKDKQVEVHQFENFGVWSVAYVPSAIGILLGRGVGLSYAGVFNLGRFCNLLMYIILIVLAIKRVKYGKVLIATIGLIPTTIFMASCYSYDPWVIGFTILGFSYFFAELQDEKPLEIKNMILMIGALVLGCIPKAIYFPLLFPLLFLPKKKFKDSKQRKWYYAFIIGAGIFLVATFMLPMLINGAGTGDIRGGGDVNSTEQILFILQNPLAYMKILFKFLLDYVAFANSGSMLQKFAYVGDGYCYTIVGLLLIVVAFLDRDQNGKNYNIVKGAGLVGCAVAIVLSTTALYISFTAVGAGTVAGMQARYMLPTVFPALYFIGLNGTSHKINKNAFVCVPMLIIALTFIFNMFRLCVLHY